MAKDDNKFEIVWNALPDIDKAKIVQALWSVVKEYEKKLKAAKNKKLSEA